MNNAFVYCWTDHLNNKLYVGSHKGSPDDGYVCSSKHMLKEHNARPQDFTRQIIACGTHDDMRKFESVILQSVNAKLDEQFYNKHNNKGDFYRAPGYKLTEKHKDNISRANKGNKRPDLAERNRIYKSAEMKKWKSENTVSITEETRQKMSQSAKNRVNIEALSKASAARKPRTAEQNKKHAEAMRLYHQRKRSACHAQ